MSDCNSSSYLQNVSVVGRSSMQWGRGHFSEQYCSEYDELLKSLFESKQSTRKTNYEIFNEIKIQSNFVFYHTQSITKITLQPRGGKTELQRVDKDLNGQGQGRPREVDIKVASTDFDLRPAGINSRWLSMQRRKSLAPDVRALHICA